MRKLLQFSLLGLLVLDIPALIAVGYFMFASTGAVDSSDTELRNFTVEEGQGARQIAANLEQAGIISNDVRFTFYVWRDKSAKLLRAGEYALSPSMPIPEIVRILKEGEVIELGVKVTIPEGYTTAQIEAILIAAGIDDIRESELQEAVGVSAPLAHEIFGFDFLLDLPARATIDGFLFPDTYFFDEDAQLNDIVMKMFENFDQKVPEPTRVRIKALGKTLYEVVIMASLVEKEVQTPQDMKVVSGVLWKRLKIGMPLQVDATLSYITGKKTGEITNEDKFVDSPYNTYRYRGLPPTPIANPGLSAIMAAMEPTESEYLYYLSAPSGETIFAKTLDEHNANKARYLR